MVCYAMHTILSLKLAKKMPWDKIAVDNQQPNEFLESVIFKE